MKRWLLTTAAVSAVATLAPAQTTSKAPVGYIVIRVKLGTDGGDTSAPGTGTPNTPGVPGLPGPMPGFPGGGIAPGGPGPGSPYPGGPGGIGGGPGGVGGGSNPLAGLNERSVHVLIPYMKLDKEKLYPKKTGSDDKNPTLPLLVSTFGHTLFYPDKVSVQYDVQPFAPEEGRLTAEYKKWNESPNRKPAVLLGYIGDALRADLLPLAERYSDALVTQFEKADTLPADVAAYIKGYKELKAKWNEPLANNPAADTWKAKFGPDAGVYTDSSPHYSLVHFTSEPTTGVAVVADAAVRTAEQLERNFKSFYLWHLREGFALKLPEKRLVVVLAKSGEQLENFRKSLDGLPKVADSFYSPQHNLTVLSPERTDALGRSFAKIAATKTEGFDREALLKGVHPVLKKDQKPEEIAVASTYALVKKAVDDEALSAAISREASRQLFVTLGVVPRHVRLPKWVENGLGSLPHHPKGGGVEEVAKGTPGVVVGVYTGHGAANYEHLNRFLGFYPAKGKDGKENKDLKPSEVLANVLADAYFDAVAKGTDPDRPPSLTDPKPLPGGGGVRPPVGPGGGVMPPIGPGGGGIVPPIGPMPGGGGGGIMPPMPGVPGRPPVAPGGPGGVGPKGGDAQQPPPMPGFPGGGPQIPPGGPGPGGPIGPGGPGIPGGPGGILDPNAVAPPLTPVQLEQKAQATAWALTYFLTKNGKMATFHKYLAKLNELPRDMRVDKEVSKRLFCEAFGMLKPGGTEIDATAFDTFAKEWLAEMHRQPQTYQLIALKKFEGERNEQPGGNPGGPGGTPGFPGGGPGFPGGGPGIPGPGIPGGGGPGFPGGGR